MKYLRGIACAATSSATFGLAPLFTLLLLADGLSPFEVLFYRWGVASTALLLAGLASGRRFRLSRRELAAIAPLGLLRAATSLSLVIAYRNIASGTASIIHFMYPLAVALAATLFFRERLSRRTAAALVVSMAGVALLSCGGIGSPEGGNAPLGIAAAACSVFAYGGYIIGVRKSRAAAAIEPTLFTCYITSFGALLFLCGGLLTGGIAPVTEGRTWLAILGLALPATALSNLTLVKAIRYIGPTLASVFGALEPLTAVVIGATLFAEPFSGASAVGMLLIIGAVIIVVLDPQRRAQ